MLIDPPFEATDDRDRLTRALIGAWRKWPGGVYMAWFPVKTPAAIRQLADAMRQAGMDKALIAELGIGLPDPDGPLVSSAVALVNPPFTLADDLRQVLPALAKRLAGDSGYGRLHEVADGRKAG